MHMRLKLMEFKSKKKSKDINSKLSLLRLRLELNLIYSVDISALTLRVFQTTEWLRMLRLLLASMNMKLPKVPAVMVF